MKKSPALTKYLPLILFFNIVIPLLFFVYILRLNSILDKQQNVWLPLVAIGVNSLLVIVEGPIFLTSLLYFFLRRFKVVRISAVLGLVAQIVVIFLLTLPVTRNQIAVLNYSANIFGVTTEQRLPLGIFKTDYKAPGISFTSPSNFDLIEKGLTSRGVSGDSFNISVEVTDDSPFKRTSFGDFEQSPLSVTIYIDNSKVRTFSSSPYNYSWDLRNVSKGQHIIEAVAIDDDSNSSTISATLKVN